MWIAVFVLTVLIIQRWLADVCLIPTDSMENTILAGDRILVCKIGNNVVRRNDVIIFNHPDGNGIQLVKRCVGLPGDTVTICNDIVYVNGRDVAVPSTVKTSASDFPVDFPHPNLGWTIRNYGPVIAPAKGRSVRLDSINANLYRHIVRIEKEEEAVPYPNISKESYTFRTDGYFVLGDNRSNSIDSRYWGFVPKDAIIGKAVLVYFSKDMHQGRIRWNRTGKVLK